MIPMEEPRQANREYKDRLFKFIFGNPENKEWTLSLYNAVNGSHYTDASAIQLNTIEDAVYMGMKNDVSFLMANTLNLYEQQSTFNPNMPMRFLIYAGMVYSKYIESSKHYRRHSSMQQHAPTPRCVCFYNGTADKEDKTVLHLASAFTPDSSPDIEVRVTMININFGHNKELMGACRPLQEYAWFVNEVRLNQKRMDSLEEAIDRALDKLSDDSLIKPFLIANKAEVKSMCITEYDQERAYAEQMEEGIEKGIEIGMEKGRAEGMEKGRAEGMEKGRVEGGLRMLFDLVKKGIVTLAQAAEQAQMSVPEFEAKMAAMNG